MWRRSGPACLSDCDVSVPRKPRWAGMRSTLPQRFACARSCSDFAATFTTIAFDNSSWRWLEINTLSRPRRTGEGATECAAPLCINLTGTRSASRT